MSATGVTFAVRDIESGWAVADITAGDAAVTLDGFSYTTDAFGDLTTFAIRAALDNCAAEFDLDAEPGGWRLRFEDASSGLCRFEVRAFTGRAGDHTALLAADVSRDDLALAVLNCMDAISADLGIDAFEAAWMDAYPVRAVAALRSALSVSRRATPELAS